MSAELYHHGILGMKWGVRRSEQQLRRARATASMNKMSDDDLRKAINRMQLERQYKSLTKREISFGEKWVNSVLNDTSKQLATKYLTKAATKIIDQALSGKKK